MHKIEMLRDTLCEELEKVAKKEEISSSDLDVIDKLAHSIKNLDKILMGESYESRGSYGSYGNGSNRSYGSYARRGRDGDGDGRYGEGRRSRDSYGSYESYERGDSREYSRDMKNRLRKMMEESSNERERDTIMRCISQLDD